MLQDVGIMDDDNSSQPPPTPEQIAATCLEIQATWTDDERIARRNLDRAVRTLTARDVERGVEVERMAREQLAGRGAD